jgi:hypothetical protein
MVLVPFCLFELFKVSALHLGHHFFVTCGILSLFYHNYSWIHSNINMITLKLFHAK